MNLGKLRRISQLISLTLACGGFLGITAMHIIYPFLHCYACPLATAACPIGIMQRFIALGEIPWYPLGSIALYGITLGRLFCGWACPFGLLQDLLDKITKRKVTISKRAHKKAILVKFVVLSLTLLLAWMVSDVLFCKICPAATIEAAIPYHLQHETTFTTLFATRILIFGFLILLMIAITRFWCRYLCPFGAWLAVFNKVSLMHVEVNQEKCNGCGMCEKICPMQIEIIKLKKSTECIKCGICVEECPNKAIKFVVPP
ncbi:MAG: 4Fe-4S binding protein [Candidatus Bathyarchaeia archaeon]